VTGASAASADDRGAAFERTSLAWNRTGLTAAGAGALALKVFWDRTVLGLALAGLLLGIGVLAYAAGAHPPVAPVRLRALSLGVTAAAVLGVVVAIVG
jgi:hypothetical protein